MTHPQTGLDVQHRKWRLKHFPNTFVGSEAVSWISQYMTCSRSTAVVVGQELLNAAVFHHICREHEFEDAKLFYRWHTHDPENAYVMNIQRLNLTPSARRAEIVVFELLEQLLVVCESHRTLNDNSQLDIGKIQRDGRYNKFSIASREMQSATLHITASDAEKTAFLVNMYNLMSLHTSIILGTSKGDNSKSLRIKRKFQYNISGIRFSLFKISSMLFNDCRDLQAHSHMDLHSTQTLSSGVRATLPIPITRFKTKTKYSDAETRQFLISPQVDPMVLFLIDDGEPHSPDIGPISEANLSMKELILSSAEYLDSVLYVSLNPCCLTYPRNVSLFRKMENVKDDSALIETLIIICKGWPIEKELAVLRDRCFRERIFSFAKEAQYSE